MGQSECKGCSAADPTTDTVKVNPNAVTSENQVKLAAQAQQQEDEMRADREIEEAKRHRAETQRRAELERERLKREKEETEAREARERQQAEEEAAAAEAEQKRKDTEAAEAAEQEKNRTRAEEMARKGAEHKSEEFLKNHGFKAPAMPKTSCFAHTYPLHTAVKENNAEAVKALVACGADPQVKSSSGKTPLDVAQKLNKRESHQAVIAALGGC